MAATATQPATAAPADEISGKVVRLYAARDGFSAGVFLTKGREVKFVYKGGGAPLKVSEPYTFKGHWVDNARFGRQWNVTELVYRVPTDPAGLVTWLECYVPCVGAVKAQKLVDEYGVDLPRLCQQDPQQVAIFAGIPVESIHRVAREWEKFDHKMSASTQLLAWGMTAAQTEKIVAKLGSAAVRDIQDDPYVTYYAVDGIGWKTADAIAEKVGVTGDDPRRLRCAVAAVVQEAAERGSTCVPYAEACRLAAEKLGLPAGADALAAKSVAVAVEQGRLTHVHSEESGGGWLAAPRLHRQESVVWRVLATGRDPNPQFDYVAPEAAGTRQPTAQLVAERYATVEDKALDAGQLNAVVTAAKFRITCVTGGAGAGKTLVIKAIARLFDDGDVPVMLCAPTGKAARRIEEVVGRTASTIHRLLEYCGSEGRFFRDADNPLPPGVVVCDEASMCDVPLAYHLLAALGPKTALVLVGDDHQLPPVGPGAVLRDVLAQGLVPTTKLQGCHRQAGTLKRNCVAVLSGSVQPTCTTEEPSPWWALGSVGTQQAVDNALVLLYERYLRKWGYDPVRDTQIMTAKHQGPFGTKRLNLLLQALHQKALGNPLQPVGADDHERRPTLYPGDKVIQTRNNYELDVMNGTVGVVVSTTPLVVNFDGAEVGYPPANRNEVELAYVLTPHKCVHPDTLVETAEGLLPIRLIQPTGQIASPAAAAPYLNKVENPVGPALKIETKHGYQITVTPDHRCEVWDGNNYVMRLASELKSGQWVRVRLGATIDPTEAATLPPPPTADARATRYPTPTTVTEDVAEFLGLMVADGTIYADGFRLVKRHRDVAERFGALCRTLFGAKTAAVKNGRATGYEVRSTFLRDWLLSIGGLAPNAKAIPECVLRSPATIHAAFLRGLFEDGTVNIKDGVCDHVEFTSVYEPLVRTVQVMLLRLGIIASVVRRDDPANAEGRHFRLYVYGNNAAIFRDRVGFVSAFKRDRLEFCIEHERRYSMPVSRPMADSLTAAVPAAVSNARFRRTVSRDTARQAGWNDRLGWFDDSIASITPTVCPSMCVEVPDGNRFLQAGFPWWNCQGSEFPCAVVIVPKAHGFMQHRSWLYTATTRARKTCVVIGDADGIRQAAERVEVDKRRTLLEVWGANGEGAK